MNDKPSSFPKSAAGGAPLKALTDVLIERRATDHFLPDPVPDEYLDAMLRFAAQAPSGYNLQPWRFVVVRDPENRRRLRAAAFDQEKVSEAPVVVIAVGMKEEFKSRAEEVFREGAERGLGKIENAPKIMAGAFRFISTLSTQTWLNRHVMIAFTTLMYMAEAYGFDTAAMEGFDPAAVKREFGLPDEAEVVALLAIGRARMPDKNYGGRFGLDRIVYAERYGEAWPRA